MRDAVVVIVVAVVFREQFLRVVMRGGGGVDPGAVGVEGAEVGWAGGVRGVDGGVDGHLCCTWGREQLGFYWQAQQPF